MCIINYIIIQFWTNKTIMLIYILLWSVDFFHKQLVAKFMIKSIQEKFLARISIIFGYISLLNLK